MSESTKIIQCFLPPMAAGVYTAEVTQSVIKEGKNIENITKAFKFGVDAARFTLNPNDIYSVYPPANTSGSYGESLPHIVFSRRTLPWERTIDGRLPVFQREDTPVNKRNPQDSQPVPWMALLLFTDDEMADLHIDKNTLAGIIQPNAADGVIRPQIFESDLKNTERLSLMEWERTSDGCFTIDLTKGQFDRHIPSIKSLPYLAHAKEVSIENKDKEGITDINSDGSGVFSVLVGSRIPVKGKQHTAIVVSLEGHFARLKGASLSEDMSSENKVRLVVLASWIFSNSGESGFLQLVNGLEIKSLKVQKDKDVPELKKYFESGYAPLEHLTRAGAKTISWYHGPFTPKMYPSPSNSATFSSSDAALRYDKTTGFFDVSFAAAWQLGRMLGLQNLEFCKALLNWHYERMQINADTARKATAGAILEDRSAANIKEKVIHYLGRLHEVETILPEIRVTDGNSVPQEVKNFLGELYRLNGVPFQYLVPHEYLLEKSHTASGKEFSGTMALFYVDANWLEALLGGALSIGRLDNTAALLDRALAGEFLQGYTEQSFKNLMTEEDKTDNKLNTTGFLLRSDLVSGWRGLDIKAFDANGKLLQALRFERINADIFLGIFNGNVESVVITQPYEGLHFGIKNDNGTYQKSLKNEDGTNEESVDGEADINQELNNGLVSDGIIDAERIAAVMHQKLVKNKYMKAQDKSSTSHFTSAEFAYQMVDSPVKRTIAIKLTTIHE